MCSIFSYTNDNKYTNIDICARAHTQQAATSFDFLILAENTHFIEGPSHLLIYKQAAAETQSIQSFGCQQQLQHHRNSCDVV